MAKFDAVSAVPIARIDSLHYATKVERGAVDQQDRQCEAKLLIQVDAECQMDVRNDVGVQAEPAKVRRSSNAKISDARLSEFVANVSPIVMQALNENLYTEAFDNWRLRRVYQSQQLTEMCQLPYELFENHSVSQLSWNASGNLLGAAYGGLQHEDFCTHRAGVVVYKVLRLTLGHREPFCVLDTQSCVTSIAFNPKSPTLLAAGTMSGEIVVWDLEAASESKIIATTGIIPDAGHREPVSTLCWILKDMASVEAYQLLSCSLDGKVILWKKPAGGSKELRPHIGLLLITDDLLRAASKFTIKLPKAKAVGITSMAYTREDNTAFLIGSENGVIIRCKRSGLKAEIKEGLSYAAALSIGYRSNSGPTTDLCFSPHNKDIFLSVATDGALKMFHSTSATPLLELHLWTEKLDGLLCCDYSPARPSVFAVGTSAGELLIFDLMRNLSEPVTRLHTAGMVRAPFDTVKFNPTQHNMLAAGNRLGVVTVWDLPESLTESDAGESIAFLAYVNSMLK